MAAGRDRNIRSIIDFALDLQSRLPSRDTSTTDLLLADVSAHIRSLTTLSQKNTTGLSPKVAKDLERQGRNLWNLCVRLKRDADDATATKEWAGLLVRARVFAFQILALGREGGRAKRDAESEIMYLTNLALTIGRLCVVGSDLESATTVLQKAAEFVEQLKSIPKEAPGSDQGGSRMKLEAEYLAMRTALSWKENNLDVAEHMFAKIENLRQSLDVASTENIADTLQHIGVDLSSKEDHVMAIKWLKRADKLINAQDLERLSIDGRELRLAIFQGLIQAYLGVASSESIQLASDLASYVESEVGDKPVVLHWRLEILQKSPGEVFDAETYSSILRRMIRTFDFSEGTFHFLLHHIKELRDKNPKLACGVLDELLKQRVLLSGKTEWISKTVIRRIWMGTMEVISDDAVTGLKTVLDLIWDTISEHLGSDAAGAAHSLIWKRVEALIAKKQYQIAEKWCSIALHRLFSSCGEANQGKFGRKRIICALGLNDTESARDAFQSMPNATQNDALTSYLMFKVSLVSWDHELGCESIQRLTKCADRVQSQNMLYACIREAQQTGDRICTVAALKAVAESWDVNSASTSNFPSILRCTLRLIHLIEDAEDANERPDERPGFAEDICKVFEKAAEHAKLNPRDCKGGKVFTVAELDWFRKNAYNMGAGKCDSWGLSHLIRIFSACLTIIGCYPSDIPLNEAADTALMSMRCHFVIAAALVSLARAEDKMDEQLQRYLEMRRHVAAFDALLQTEIGTHDEEVARDLLAKLSTLFVFDFEGAVRLMDWDDLSEIVRKAKMCKDEVMYKAMGDCLLRAQAPGKVLYATMKLIINEISELEQFDYEKLAKYTRCMLQVMLPLEGTLAMQLLDKALQIARESSQVGKLLPSAEVEWFASTTFNHAIDLHGRGEAAACHSWALKAMNLADYAGDSGGLKRVLEDKLAKLNFNGQRQGR